MPSMLNKKKRINSAKQMNSFLQGASCSKFDIVVVNSKKVASVYWRVSGLIQIEIFPNMEMSYSFSVRWDSSESIDGQMPLSAFPPEPYKSYFNIMYCNSEPNREKYLWFNNTWKENMWIGVFKSDIGDLHKQQVIEFVREFGN